MHRCIVFTSMIIGFVSSYRILRILFLRDLHVVDVTLLLQERRQYLQNSELKINGLKVIFFSHTGYTSELKCLELISVSFKYKHCIG